MSDKRPSAVELSAATNGASVDVQQKLADLLRDAKRNKAREAAAAQKPCYVLYPESRVVSAKDMMSFVALMLTFVVVPFEVSFVDAPAVPDPTDALWIFNRIVDLMFTVDICAQFFVGLTKPNPFLEQAKENGMEEGDIDDIIGTVYEFRLRYIFWDYLKGWMLLDVGAMGPSVFEVYFAISSGLSSSAKAEVELELEAAATPLLLNATMGNATDYDASGLAAARSLKLVRATRVLKLFRLLKLVKLLRAIKMFNDPDGPFQKIMDKITLAFIAHMRKLAILKLCLIFLVLGHVQACVLGLCSVVVDRRADTWWGTLGYCFPDEATVELLEQAASGGAAALQQAGRALASKAARGTSSSSSPLYYDPLVMDENLLLGVDIPCVGPFSQYFVCIAWAFEFNFGVNTFYTETGPGTPLFLTGSAATFQTHEALLFLGCGLTGALMGVYLQARVVDVLTSKPSTAESVNAFCKRFNVRRDIRKNLQVYFERLSKIPGTKPAGDLFSTLSPSLAQQVMLDVHEGWLQRLPFHGFVTREDSPFAAVRALGRARRSSELRLHAWTLLSRIALEMQPTLLIPKESPSQGRMYVVLKGVAIDKRSGNLLTVNDNWGATDAICGMARGAAAISAGRLERIEALTFLQLFFIEAEAIAAVVQHAPELHDAYLKLRAWGLLQRLFTCILTAAEIEHMKKAAAVKPNSPGIRAATPASPLAVMRTLNKTSSVSNLFADVRSPDISPMAQRETSTRPLTITPSKGAAKEEEVGSAKGHASNRQGAPPSSPLDKVLTGIELLQQQQRDMEEQYRASQEAMSKQIASLVAEVRRAATVRADYSA